MAHAPVGGTRRSTPLCGRATRVQGGPHAKLSPCAPSQAAAKKVKVETVVVEVDMLAIAPKDQPWITDHLALYASGAVEKCATFRASVAPHAPPTCRTHFWRFRPGSNSSEVSPPRRTRGHALS